MTQTAQVEVFADSAGLVEAARTRLVDTLVAAQRDRGSASVVLTGGSNGIALLTALRADSGALDWSALDIYWGDERFVAAADDERNAKQAFDALLGHVPVDPARVFEMAPSDGAFGDDIDAAALAYADTLFEQGDGAVPQFDVHLLGMGPEGHINSLFPHTPAVAETQKVVVSVSNSPKPPPQRITLTLPAVNRSHHVWFLVAGADKAQAAAAGISGADEADWPCAGAHGRASTVWFLDEGAASAL